jgi:hypothetical protein
VMASRKLAVGKRDIRRRSAATDVYAILTPGVLAGRDDEATNEHDEGRNICPMGIGPLFVSCSEFVQNGTFLRVYMLTRHHKHVARRASVRFWSQPRVHSKDPIRR